MVEVMVVTEKECVMFQSTFIKQMKIIHSGEEEGGWSEEERIKYR